MLLTNFYRNIHVWNAVENSSQPSIQKVVEFALKHYAKCGEDFWDCIVQECEKVRCPAAPSLRDDRRLTVLSWHIAT
jgi:hypothetical protein